MHSHVHRCAKPTLLILIAYWVCLFIGTHTPQTSQLTFTVTDKALHYAAYLGLALLLALTWSLYRPLVARGYAAVLAVLAAYGAVDELLQIPVGRHGDPLDWIADMCGVLSALALFWMAARLRGRARTRSEMAKSRALSA